MDGVYCNQLFPPRSTDLQETVYASNQNISFGARKTIKSVQSSLHEMKEYLDGLVEMSVIPVRPILKSERSRDICQRI